MDPGYAVRARRCHVCHGPIEDGECPFCQRFDEVMVV